MNSDKRDDLLLAIAAAVTQIMNQSCGRADQPGWISVDYKATQRELSRATHSAKQDHESEGHLGHLKNNQSLSNGERR